MSKTRPVPILTDDSLNRAFAIKNFIFVLFGLAGLALGVPSSEHIVGEIGTLIITAVIVFSAAAACVGAWMSRWSFGWQKLEFYSTIVMTVFLAFYVIALVYFIAMGDPSRINLAIITSALLVMPVWRLLYLLRNHKKRN